MIDQILSKRGSSGENEILPDFSPDLAITATRLVNPSSSTLTVVFPPWHGAGKFTARLEQRIIGRGSGLLAFDFHDHVLEPNVEGVIETYTYLQDKIADQINELYQENKYTEIHLVSISLGIVPLMMVSRKLKFFSRATLVLAGSSLAACLWDGIRTQKMRQALENKGYDLGKLKTAWAKLEPNYDVSVMAGKDVHMLISDVDQITPLKYAEELKQDLIDVGVGVGVSRSKLGHAVGIIRFCLLPPGRLRP